ncbi:Multidrug resistance efflux pump [Nitrosomonas ureae]|uniref:Multidrug resistance efflux pump n=1 Tax=Nitrosomonas ureae TaxID=44577 RepID=A0A285BY29_9PROT|nr:efflux RND transporter periplasmic adaptor subunit [Nitrosomonas ureae]SNX60162.1 Multidrug resistance efflux pump [Nitrosomonas ureae]
MKIRFNQPENKAPNIDRGLRVHYSEAKRPGRPWRWYSIVAISSLPIVYLLGIIIWETIAIEASGRIRVNNFSVRTAVDGYVQQIFVEPMQTVFEGKPLAELTNTPLLDSHDRLHIELNALKKEQQKLLTQVKRSSSRSAQLSGYAQEHKRFAYNRLQHYEALFKQGAATQAEMTSAKNQYQRALENIVALEKAEHQEQDQSSEMRRISNQMRQMQLEFEKVRDQLQQLSLVAPAGNGIVTEVFVQPGEYLSRGQALLEIIFPEKVHIDAFIPPKYQNYAVEGQIVTVKFPNGEKTKAKIISVPGVTQKTLTEEVNPLEPVRTAILAQLEFIEQVNNRLINGMPVTIYF